MVSNDELKIDLVRLILQHTLQNYSSGKGSEKRKRREEKRRGEERKSRCLLKRNGKGRKEKELREK